MDAVGLVDVFRGVTELAGEVPFAVLRNDGARVECSSGFRALGSGVFALREERILLSERGLLDAADFLLRRWSGEHLQYYGDDGRRMAFCVHTCSIPTENPLFVLLRLDPVPVSFSSQEGVLIRLPVTYPDAVEFFGLWTRARKMKELFELVDRTAQTDVTVLVRGESGTGKEGIALAIHRLSKRSKAPFVAVNCAALSRELLESELFGHVKGAFTGAIRERIGLFEQADGGTIFLDEVAELPMDLQAKLLRVLQERSYLPVGGTHWRTVDVRVISATHQSLRQAVAENRFREDLMFRLRVMTLWIPNLRERREDVELLLSVFLSQLALAGRHKFERIHPKAMQKLLDFPWTGNVRELQNVMEYATVVGTGEVLTSAFLPPEFRESASLPGRPLDLTASLGEGEGDNNSSTGWASSEKELISLALSRARGKKGKAAQMLGMHRTTLWRKMKEYGLEQW